MDYALRMNDYRKILLLYFLLGASSICYGLHIFVAVDGSDSNPGTEAFPIGSG